MGRRFDTVIFDFFGTLVYNRPWGDEMNRAVADVLGGPVEGFLREWAKTAPRRTTGGYSSIKENVEKVCAALSVPITPEQVGRAVALRLEYTRRNLIPKEGAVERLRRLRGIGLKLGLLSNCTPEIPVIWPELSLAPFFDDAVFSCDVGMAKPQREIFELASRRLTTPPERCVYVADNNDDELGVAASLGMLAVRLLPSEGEKPPRDADRWQGLTIARLPELVDCLT